MEIFFFGEKDKNQYDNFLLNSKHKDILQSWEWGEVKSGFNWKTERIGFLKGGDLVGTAQVLERKLPLDFCLLYIPRGPVVDWQNQELVREIAVSMADFFKGKSRSRKVLFFRIEPPIEKNNDTLRILKEAGFRQYFKTIQPPSTLLIDLTVPEQELIKKFRRTARNLIHRSEREGISIEVLTDGQITEDNLKGFYNLYKATGKRFSFPLRPYRQFSILRDKMKGPGTLKFYTSKIKGLILAYGIVLLLGDRAFYIWGGTGRHKDYSRFFNYGYIWEMLKDLKKSGIKTFDFWGLGPENNKNHPWYGFTLFKTAFDGNNFDYIGAFDLSASKLYVPFKLLDKIITPKYRATAS